MLRIQRILFVVVISTTADAFLWWNWNAVPAGKKWNTPTVTFPKFNDLPATCNDAKNSGWMKTASCSASSYFVGNRYILNGDMSTMVLYDSKGNIAGIQFAIENALATHPSFRKSYWNQEGNFSVITAYFVHPSTICSGQTAVEDNLYIQIGPSPNNLINIPYKESDIGSTMWVKGRCFVWMGQHYWYNVSKEMSCDDAFPVFLLYDSGKLTGFGWAMIAGASSDRVEHPTPDKFKWFFDSKTQPKCLDTAGTLTTQHIYLKRNPRYILCNPLSLLKSALG